MTIDILLKRLNDIDEILLNQYHTVTKKIASEYVSFKEPKHSFETIDRIAEEKTSIIKKLNDIGLITDDEMAKYWLSEEYSFTPKISYDNVKINAT